jgi:hypothetical protein
MITNTRAAEAVGACERRVAVSATGFFFYLQTLRETTTTKAPRNGKKGPAT